jgi:hypothetical protein
MIYKHLSRSIALVLAFLMIVHTVPVFAAEASIGSVSAVGSVDLRGVAIAGDGTVFSGDRLNVAPGAYAKVALGAGPKIEVDGGSDVTITRTGDNVQVQMASGNVAFKGAGKNSVRLRVGAYEITASGDASGNVAYIGKEAFGVRVMTGSVAVRNVETRQSFIVQKGIERLVSLRTGAVSEPMGRLVSAGPAAIPAPALPQGQGGGLSKGGWIAVLGTVAGAATAVIILATKNDDSDDDASTRLAQVQALQNLNAISSSATATNSLATTVNTTAENARTAINNSNVANKATLQASVSAVIAQANSAATKIATLNAAIATLQNTISNLVGAPTAQHQQQLTQLLADLNSARNDANNALSALLALLSQATASGVSGVPAPPNAQPVPPPVLASASVPV